MTGYPPELLDLDLDLEADLGVDTVKQAEVLRRGPRAVRRRTRRQPLAARLPHPAPTSSAGSATRPATADRARSSAARRPRLADGTATPAAAPSEAHPTTVTGDLDAVDGCRDACPVPVLRPALDQCVPTGCRSRRGRPRRRDARRGRRRRRARQAAGRAPASPPCRSTRRRPRSRSSRQLDAWRADGEIAGRVLARRPRRRGPARLARPRRLAGGAASPGEGAVRRRCAGCTTTARSWSPRTRLGGFHGYDEAGATAPLGGAVTGFAKSYKRERPEPWSRPSTSPPSRKTAAVADLLIAETLPRPRAASRSAMPTGGAGAWASATRPFPPQGAPARRRDDPRRRTASSWSPARPAASSRRSRPISREPSGGGTFHLLDLTPEPDPADPDLRQYVDGPRRPQVRPRREDEANGASGRHRCAIEKELARLRAAGRGADRDRRGARGRRHGPLPLGGPHRCGRGRAGDGPGPRDQRPHRPAAARGRDRDQPRPPGQGGPGVRPGPRRQGRRLVQRAAARQATCRSARRSSSPRWPAGSATPGRPTTAPPTTCCARSRAACARTRPETRAIALDWTAWGGIGMATRGSIPKIMEMAGIEMLPPEAGVAWIRRELTATASAARWSSAGALGPDGRRATTPRAASTRPRCDTGGSDHRRRGRRG